MRIYPLNSLLTYVISFADTHRRLFGRPNAGGRAPVNVLAEQHVQPVALFAVVTGHSSKLKIKVSHNRYSKEPNFEDIYNI